LDADDGLHVDYLRLLADWRARHRGELSPTSTFAYACSSRSLNWKSAEAKGWEATSAGKKPKSVHLNAFYERQDRGCVASGLAMFHVVLDGAVPPCAPRPCSANHDKLRVQPFQVKNIVVDASSPSSPPPVFRVRSVTSTGGNNQKGVLADVSPAAVAADYGLSLVDLLGLTRYIKRHEVAVAKEMLGARAARGFNSQYKGAPSKKAASALEGTLREVINVDERREEAARCYARRYADLVGTLCAGEVESCESRVLHRHYLKQGKAQGHLWGCGKQGKAQGRARAEAAASSRAEERLAEEAARAFVLARSDLVEGTAAFDAAVAAARELARTF
jgi:uncharacterized protein YciI